MRCRFVHRLFSTKLRCALPKCTSVQNYIVNLDLHIRCQPLKYFTMHPCHCAPPEYVHCHPTWKIAVIHRKKCQFCACSMWTTKKCWEWPQLLKKVDPPCASWCQSVVCNVGRWCTMQLCTVEVVHNVGPTNPERQMQKSIMNPWCTLPQDYSSFQWKQSVKPSD